MRPEGNARWPAGRFLLAAVAVLGGVIGPSQGARAAGVVRGAVTDAESGEVLGFASVVAESGPDRIGVIAGPEGEWRLELAPAVWIIRVSFVGYAGFADTVRVTEGKETVLEVALAPEAFEIEGVQVWGDLLGTEPNVPSAVSLSADRIRAIPAFGEVDPIRTLQYLPGVQTASDISSGLYVRGGGPDQTLILLDGVPIYNPTHAFGLFSTFNADIVDRVTLYKGAYPVKYAGRLGAVLDVENRDGSREGVHGRAGISTIAARASVGGPVARGSWMVAGRRTYLDPVLDRLRSDNPEIPYYYFYDLNGRVAIPLAGADRLEWNGYLGQDDLHVDLDQDTFIDQRWGNRAMSLEYSRLLGESLVGSLMVSGSAYDSRTSVQLFTTPVSFANRLRDWTGKAEVAWEGTDHRVTGGLQGTRYEFLLEQEFNGVVQPAFDEKPWDLSVFVEDELTPNERTNLRIGLRVRRYSEGGRVLFEPRGSAIWPISGRTRLRLATGLYHQYVQLVATEGFSGADFYLPIDETLDPGFSWQSTAGLEFEPTREWRLTVDGYYTALRNLVTLDNNQAAGSDDTSSEAVFKSGGTGWASGVELFAERRIGRVTGWIGYTLGWTRRTFGDVNGGETYAPKYDRRHDFSLVLSWRNGPWRFSQTFLYGTGQAFTPATARYGLRNPATGTFSDYGQVLPGEKNTARLLPYHRMDVAVSRDFKLFGLDSQAVFQVFNLYSRRNEWFIQYDSGTPNANPEVVQQLPVIPSLGVNFEF